MTYWKPNFVPLYSPSNVEGVIFFNPSETTVYTWSICSSSPTKWYSQTKLSFSPATIVFSCKGTVLSLAFTSAVGKAVGVVNTTSFTLPLPKIFSSHVWKAVDFIAATVTEVEQSRKNPIIAAIEPYFLQNALLGDVFEDFSKISSIHSSGAVI